MQSRLDSNFYIESVVKKMTNKTINTGIDIMNKNSLTDLGFPKFIVTPIAGFCFGGINLGSSLL